MPKTGVIGANQQDDEVGEVNECLEVAVETRTDGCKAKVTSQITNVPAAVKPTTKQSTMNNKRKQSSEATSVNDVDKTVKRSRK